MGGGRNSVWRFAPVAAIAAVLALAYAFDVQRVLSIEALYDRRLALKGFVAEHLVLSVLGFLALYTIAVAFVFPAPVVLTVAGGFLFGWRIGGPAAILGATLGGSILFLAARTAVGDVLGRRAGSSIARFAEGFKRNAFAYLLVLRLTPVLPVAALNIGPALLGMKLRPFVAATFLGIIPGGLVYAFLGSGLDRALKRAGKAGEVGVLDLLTREMIVALAGLSALALLGIVLRRRFVEPDGAGNRR